MVRKRKWTKCDDLRCYTNGHETAKEQNGELQNPTSLIPRGALCERSNNNQNHPKTTGNMDNGSPMGNEPAKPTTLMTADNKEQEFNLHVGGEYQNM